MQKPIFHDGGAVSKDIARGVLLPQGLGHSIFGMMVMKKKMMMTSLNPAMVFAHFLQLVVVGSFDDQNNDGDGDDASEEDDDDDDDDGDNKNDRGSGHRMGSPKTSCKWEVD